MYKGRKKTNNSPRLNNISNDNFSSHRLKRRLDAPKMSFYIRILRICGQDRRKTKKNLKWKQKGQVQLKKGKMPLTLIGNIETRLTGRNSNNLHKLV